MLFFTSNTGPCGSVSIASIPIAMDTNPCGPVASMVKYTIRAKCKTRTWLQLPVTKLSFRHIYDL